MPEELKTIASTLGIQSIRRHIFLCADQTEAKCCSRETGLAAWQFLKQRLNELGLTEPQALVFRTKANCLQVAQSGLR